MHVGQLWVWVDYKYHHQLKARFLWLICRNVRWHVHDIIRTCSAIFSINTHVIVYHPSVIHFYCLQTFSIFPTTRVSFIAVPLAFYTLQAPMKRSNWCWINFVLFSSPNHQDLILMAFKISCSSWSLPLKSPCFEIKISFRFSRNYVFTMNQNQNDIRDNI